MNTHKPKGVTVGELIALLRKCDSKKFVSMAREEYWVIGVNDEDGWGVDLLGDCAYPDRVNDYIDVENTKDVYL